MNEEATEQNTADKKLEEAVHNALEERVAGACPPAKGRRELMARIYIERASTAAAPSSHRRAVRSQPACAYADETPRPSKLFNALYQSNSDLSRIISQLTSPMMFLMR